MAADPVIRQRLDLPDTWWNSLRTDLDTVAANPTQRVAVRKKWIARAVPAVTGCPAPHVTEWSTTHGDLHELLWSVSRGDHRELESPLRDLVAAVV
ncbi:hypothetical protein [Streptomyces mayteni]